MKIWKHLFHVFSFRKCFHSNLRWQTCNKVEIRFFFFPFTFTDASSPTCVLCHLQLLLLSTSATDDLPYGSTNNRCSMTAVAPCCYLHRAWKCRSRCLHRRRGRHLHHRHQEPRGSRCLLRLPLLADSLRCRLPHQDLVPPNPTLVVERASPSPPWQGALRPRSVTSSWSIHHRWYMLVLRKNLMLLLLLISWFVDWFGVRRKRKRRRRRRSSQQ